MSAPNAASSLLKKSMDLVLALSALIFFLPAFLLIALLVRLDSPGPALQWQRHRGLNGKLFYICKFRTYSQTAGRGYGGRLKGEGGRITPFGQFLRRSCLDEFPKLLNIIMGDMSIVGPRPHPLSDDQEFAALLPNYNERFKASPGLTSLAQVRGYRGDILSKEDLVRRLECDLEYIENWSIGLDLMTICQTLPVLFQQERAY